MLLVLNNQAVLSSPYENTGRANAAILGLTFKWNVLIKVFFHVMGKVLSGELSYTASCSFVCHFHFFMPLGKHSMTRGV